MVVKQEAALTPPGRLSLFDERRFVSTVNVLSVQNIRHRFEALLRWKLRQCHVQSSDFKEHFYIPHAQHQSHQKCWQDFDALASQISAAASGLWRNPGIIEQDRDVNTCLSSSHWCTAPCYPPQPPFPGDVTYPGTLDVCFWKMAHQIGWFFNFQTLVCTFTVSSSGNKGSLGTNGVKEHRSGRLWLKWFGSHKILIFTDVYLHFLWNVCK